jgi:hypothetical protein
MRDIVCARREFVERVTRRCNKPSYSGMRAKFSANTVKPVLLQRHKLRIGFLSYVFFKANLGLSLVALPQMRSRVRGAASSLLTKQGSLCVWHASHLFLRVRSFTQTGYAQRPHARSDQSRARKRPVAASRRDGLRGSSVLVYEVVERLRAADR